ncbi:cyclic di-GMP-binding protein FimX [Maricurvus nonylphenolicus]|uniref:EAL domain-containing protein n=1 Tax=Maricurvus nonylphenolicus TaxID=1008307 RepID=UPI0036F1A816
MNPNDTIRLLILNDSRSEAERLISMLNNAGRPNRAQHVDSEEALTKLLQDQAWDLLIGHDKTTNVEPHNAVRQIKRLGKDVPMILLTDEEGSQAVVEGIKAGATDVVQLDEDQHLLLVISRELENREQRQQRRRSDRRLKEAERRSQQLLDSSRDAIAYVQDGMYLYANQSFAEDFGYDDIDDIECMPVIDMVSEADQDKVKQFLKDFALKGEEAELTELSFNGITQDESERPLTIKIANAIYDEEPCVQFLIPAKQAGDSEELAAELQKIKDQDLVTGLFNRTYLIEQLELAVDKAAHGEAHGALIYLEIDRFEEQVHSVMSAADSDLVLGDIAALLGKYSRDDETLARFGDDNYMLLIPSIKADQALARAHEISSAMADHIVDIDNKTLQLSLSIGIALINETANKGQEIIDQTKKAATSSGEDKAENEPHIALYEPEISDEERSEQDVIKAVQAALDNNRFRLLFQPIISLRGSETEHYEVLLRMLNDNDEEISPNEFLDAAASVGLSTKIDRWVILEAIKILSEHRGKGNNTHLIVNLSHQSLCDDSLLAWLGVAFKAAKLPHDSLIFQCGEVDITNHLNAAKAFFAGLAEMKSKSSISNFGCSLNPFNTLKHVDCDYVKVDGSFTQDIQKHNEDPETLSNLIKQLHESEKITVVPFVENANVLSTLWQAGVHYIQGHYLQGPAAEMSYDFNMEG